MLSVEAQRWGVVPTNSLENLITWTALLIDVLVRSLT